MKLGIMQPYFLPYIGYFQLINATDAFVLYDNIKYTKKGWINRNRILVNGKDEYITLPLRKDSDHLNVNQRYLAESFHLEKKILRKVGENYRNAPYFSDVFELFEAIIGCKNNNLFNFVHNSLVLVCEYLGVKRNFFVSSTLHVDHTLKGEEKVLAICKEMQVDCYINPIGGIKLYSKDSFINNNMELYFLSSNPFVYPQANRGFIPNMSILDVMMFNSKDRIMYFLDNGYRLI
jgi:hypothetical protein